MRNLKIISAAVIFLGVGFLLGKSAIAPTVELGIRNLPAGQAGQELGIKNSQVVSLMIDFGNGALVTYKVVPTASTTVFSLLQETVKVKNLVLDFQDYPGMGVFVKQIGEQKNGNDKFWQYWVNNLQVQVAADKASVKAGDIIEWKYIKSQPAT